MKIAKLPDRLTEWPIGEPSARGSRNGSPNVRGRSAKHVFIENSALASVRKCPYCIRRQNATPILESCRAGRTRRGRRIWTKSSFLESSRRALQVALGRRIQIDAELAPFRAREEMQHEDTRRTAATFKDRRGRGEERHPAHCGGGWSAPMMDDNPRGRGASSGGPRRPGTPPVTRVARPPARTPPASCLRRTKPLALRARFAKEVRRRRAPHPPSGFTPRPRTEGGGGSRSGGGRRRPCSPRLPPADGAARPPGSLCAVLRTSSGYGVVVPLGDGAVRPSGSLCRRGTRVAQRTGGRVAHPSSPSPAAAGRSTPPPPPARPLVRCPSSYLRKASPEGERFCPPEAG
ncbi:hypothetical protein THAOC_03389 [Thalassiosira oceanica]|uniref:Uncharacterized protein n=1 Tax=Thalassiosira oceanica TaxID=159749 RepID=K0TPU5_THAOC|nr:hypothetical protein THAOC_03389 [Thalassiosira oceanica]|eukprot:EJK74907.1 hypothetical protein THAOC_03389 [Thalassiosira oceanica]